MYFLKSNGHIDPEIYNGGKNILDFGAGVGGSTIFFKNSLRNNVTAVDLSEISLECLKNKNIPAESIIVGDGIKLMKNTDNNTYDLVFALMLGPTSDKNFVSSFLSEATRIIKNNGKIIVFSDCGTMNYFNGNGEKIIPPSYIGGVAYVASKN